jgi:hypothetical protein
MGMILEAFNASFVRSPWDHTAGAQQKKKIKRSVKVGFTLLGILFLQP